MTKKDAGFTPVEHACMALALAAVTAGHRDVNIVAMTGAKDKASYRIAAASHWLARLSLALEMTIPVRTPSRTSRITRSCRRTRMTA